MESSAARAGIDVGTVIADTYTIEALIGRGGMGAVFLASHKRLPGKQVAIKVLHAELAGDEVLARFRREAEIASRLGHPNIVAVHDFNVTPAGTPYLVLDYLVGQSLAQKLRGGPLALDATLSIVRQIGSALAAAHREGIVHRDLKPQNIFLVPTELDGRIVEVVKVLDFGISKIRGSQTVQTQESALLGTPQYMAPEQATGQQAAVDERTDIFALGAIVYEMLCGHPAFQGASIPEVVFKVVYEQPRPLAGEVPGLPAAIVAAVQQAMAKPSGERFANIGAFVEALTGAPLSIVRPPTAAPAVDGPPTPGSGQLVKSGASAAFAQTVGSGDHGTAMAATASVPPQVASAASAVSAASATSVRGSAPTVATAPGSQAAPAAPTVPDEPEPPQASRKRGWLLGVAAAALVAVAAVVVVATGGRHDHDRGAPEPPPRLASNPPAPPPAPAPTAHDVAPALAADAAVPAAAPPASAPPKPHDSAVKPKLPAAATASAPVDAAPATATAIVAESTPEESEADPTAEPELKKHLEAAEQAIREQKWAEALQHANAVDNAQNVSPMQRAHAKLIEGFVQCGRDQDLAGANASLRAVRGYKRFHVRLLNACRKAGIELSDR